MRLYILRLLLVTLFVALSGVSTFIGYEILAEPRFASALILLLLLLQQGGSSHCCDGIGSISADQKIVVVLSLNCLRWLRVKFFFIETSTTWHDSSRFLHFKLQSTRLNPSIWVHQYFGKPLVTFFSLFGFFCLFDFFLKFSFIVEGEHLKLLLISLRIAYKSTCVCQQSLIRHID